MGDNDNRETAARPLQLGGDCGTRWMKW